MFALANSLGWFGWLGLLGLGLIAGSFLTSLTYQISRSHFSWGSLWRRSRCPRCSQPIRWYDNIPLLSYLVLGGKCRSCKKPISKRYPLIEAVTAGVFVLGGVGLPAQAGASGTLVWLEGFALPYFLFLATGMLALAVVDFERQIIPDKILFPILIFHFLILIFFSPSPILFIHFFWASLAACFFLALVFVTRGRGMGLGDVKLVFLIGLLVGTKTTLALFAAFTIGAVVGLLMVFVGIARFGKPIPFGPFLVLGMFLVLLWGEKIESMVLGGVR